MVVRISAVNPLDELEARTDDLLEQLLQLNERVELILAEHAGRRTEQVR